MNFPFLERYYVMSFSLHILHLCRYTVIISQISLETAEKNSVGLYMSSDVHGMTESQKMQ